MGGRRQPRPLATSPVARSMSTGGPMSSPGKYRLRISVAVRPATARFTEPMTHRPTPWPEPWPSKWYVSPMRSSSNAALLMNCQPSVRPTTDAQVLAGYLLGLKPGDAKPGDAPGHVSRQDAEVAKAVAAKARGAQGRQVRALDLGRPRRRPHARIVRLGRHVRWILVAGPDRRRDLGLTAARCRIEDRGRRAAAQQHVAGRGRGGALVRGVGRPHHLAVRWIAQVESVGAVAAPVRQRERPNRDSERLERRRPAVARGFCRPARARCRFRAERPGPCSRLRGARPRCGFRAESPGPGSMTRTS